MSEDNEELHPNIKNIRQDLNPVSFLEGFGWFCVGAVGMIVYLCISN